MSYILQASVTLVQFVVGLYLLIVLLRFLFQLTRADFYNPISQAIVKLTNPPLKILRRLVPGYGGIDWPSIILLLIIQTLEIVLITALISGNLPKPAGLAVLSIAHLLQLTIYVYIFMILIMIVISWVNPGAYNPLTVLIHQLTEPLMQPVRRKLPTTGGLDWSPMAVLLGLYLTLSLIIAPLLDLGNSLSGLPFRLP